MKKINVLYEDKDILAIDKPAGILVCPDGRSDKETIFDIFLKKYPELGVVHRLDKETTGVLLLAKNEKAHEFLKKQFADRTIKKTYLAIVNGWPKSDHGKIDKPIGRSPSDFRRRLAGRGARGEMREAVTEWRVIKRMTLPINPDKKLINSDIGVHQKKISDIGKFSVLELNPKTGRTHQIRVHLKYLSYPIVCDPLYNPKGACPKGLDRMGLHAKSIEFSALGGSASGGKTPSGKVTKVESPTPKEFEKMLKYKDESGN